VIVGGRDLRTQRAFAKHAPDHTAGASMDDSNPYRAPSGVTLANPGVDGYGYGEVQVFSLHGRIGRLRYLAYSMLSSLVLVVPAILVGATLVAAGEAVLGGTLIGAGYLAAAVFTVVLSVRRCHDLDWSGWLAVLIMVPLLNLALYMLPGSAGANRFGLQPPPNTSLLKVLGVLLLLAGIGFLAAVAGSAYDAYSELARGAAEATQ
jgi:uncharacterized membrane protein YhaH (DUF805 family)